MQQPFFCSSCGKQNAPDAKFCNECAKPLFYQKPVQPQPQPPPIEKPIGSWWSSQAQSTKMIIVAGAFLVFLVSVMRFSSSRHLPTEQPETKPSAIKAPEPPPKRTELNAEVRFTGTQFIIKNKESVDLTNVKMEINGGVFSGGYQLHHNTMKASDTYTVGAMQFADSDGKRFNPFQMKPQKFTISADSSIGHLFYVGGWN